MVNLVPTGCDTLGQLQESTWVTKNGLVESSSFTYTASVKRLIQVENFSK